MAAGSEPVGSGPNRDARTTLWRHGLVVGLLLLAGMLVIQPNGWYSVDEGASVLQARALSGGDGWAVDHPLAAIDPDGSAFGPRSAEPADGGFAFYARHPAYPALLSQVDRVGGIDGQVLLSVLATVAAALLTGMLAFRIDPRIGPVAVYSTALVSPLLFHGYLVIAHSLGAAFVAAASLIVASRMSGRAGPGLSLPALSALVAAAVLVRSEALLLALSSVLVLGGWAAVRRAWGHLATPAAIAIGATGALLADVWARDAILVDRAQLPGRSATRGGDYFVDRAEGFMTTVVRGSYGLRSAHVLLLLAVCLFAVSVPLIRRSDPRDQTVGGVLMVLAAGAVAWRVVFIAPSAVPGLLPAFPLLWVGIAVSTRRALAQVRGSLTVAAAFCLAVLATQYAIGGGLEWGWRYVAVALPLVVPAALLGIGDLLGRVDAQPRALVAVALVLASVALAGLMIRELRDSNQASRDLARQIERVAVPSVLPSQASDFTDSRPIVVTAEFAVPQILWPLFEDVRWLRLPLPEADTAPKPSPEIEAMLDAGVDRFTFLSRSFDRDEFLLGDADQWQVESRETWGAWDLVVIRGERG